MMGITEEYVHAKFGPDRITKTGERGRSLKKVPLLCRCTVSKQLVLPVQFGRMFIRVISTFECRKPEVSSLNRREMPALRARARAVTG